MSYQVVVARYDVPFGSNEVGQLLADIYTPSLGQPRGAILLTHGGGHGSTARNRFTASGARVWLPPAMWQWPLIIDCRGQPTRPGPACSTTCAGRLSG